MHPLTTVEIAKISPEPLFQTRFLSDDRPLKTSIQNFGVFYPPRLLKQGDQLKMIDGSVRIKISKEAGHKDIVCFVYENSQLDIPNAFLMCLELNHWSRKFNIVEKAYFIKAAHEIYGGQNIPKAFWAITDVLQNIRAIHQYQDVLRLPEIVQKYAINNHIPLPVILGFLKFPKDEIERIATQLFILPLNQNKLFEILNLLADISKQEMASPFSIIEGILPEMELEFNAQKKEQLLRQILHKRRNPLYEGKLAEFENKVKKIPINTTTKITPSPFFEENFIEVSTRFTSPEDINTFIAALKHENWSYFFKQK